MNFDGTLTRRGWSVIGLLLVTFFAIGLTLHTPPQACAENADCARAPINDIRQ